MYRNWTTTPYRTSGGAGLALCVSLTTWCSSSRCWRTSKFPSFTRDWRKTNAGPGHRNWRGGWGSEIASSTKHLNSPAGRSNGWPRRVRVPTARALENEPLLTLADEPTGNLDSRSGTEILELFDELHGQGKTVVLVT